MNFVTVSRVTPDIAEELCEILGIKEGTGRTFPSTLEDGQQAGLAGALHGVQETDGVKDPVLALGDFD